MLPRGSFDRSATAVELITGITVVMIGDDNHRSHTGIRGAAKAHVTGGGVRRLAHQCSRTKPVAIIIRT